MTDGNVEFANEDYSEFGDPDETDAEWIRLLAGWFAKGHFPSADELPVSACWPASEYDHPWESEAAWALVTDVDRQAFMTDINRILGIG